MTKQSRQFSVRVHMSKRLAMAVGILGLLANVPYLSVTWGQDELQVGTQQMPLIGVTSSTQNPLQIALLHWYNANMTTTFPAGSSPSGAAFDGANIWVASYTGTVAKIRANDGAALGTFTVGSGAYFLAFDGANMWVANNAATTVTKLRARDGAVLGTFQAGSSPTAVAFDGKDIWVSNFNSSTVTKLRASDGTILGTFTVGSLAAGVAFDGTNIWVVNQGSNNVTKLRPSDVPFLVHFRLAGHRSA